MWSDFLFSVQTVLPLLLLMAAGYGARRFGVMDDQGVKQANSAVFHVFLPVLLCLNTMDTPVGAAVEWGTLLYAMAAVLLLYLVMFPLSGRVCGSPFTRGVLIQGVARSNYAIYGIPLVLRMYPDTASAIPALMVVAVVPLFNVMATVALMLYSGKKVNVWGIVRGVLLNPLIMGTLAGFAMWRLQWRFPALLDQPLRALGGIATPLALFLLGASIDFGKARANVKLLTFGVAGRLIGAPLLFLSLAVALGIRDVNLAVLIAVFASPTAVSSYPMAQQIGGDADFAAAQVVLTTAFSSLTVFLWIFIFRALGFLG